MAYKKRKSKYSEQNLIKQIISLSIAKIPVPIIIIIAIVGVIFAYQSGYFANSNTNTSASSYHAKINGNADRGPNNFIEAKKIARQLHADRPLTFYCGCEYDKQGNIDLASCGYVIQKDQKRALRLEWEHIVPVSLWGRKFQCWHEAVCCNNEGECSRGRNCCSQINPEFAKMEADLHNLVPEIGELNAIRSNFSFAILPNKKAGQFGICEMKVDASSQRAEPPAAVRGIVARAYLYMAETYNIALSPGQKQLYQSWNTTFPPTEWEILWDKRVARIQGNYNPYIAQYQDKK